jgi:DNA-binding SARP family transcriptional activator/streptogramin lyase
VSPSEIEFRILGPLEVSAGGDPVRLGGPRQRALLAVLLLHSGEVVSSERLAEGIWGDATPASARHLVQVYVSQLRGALDGSAPIVTRDPGYMVDVAPSQVDALRFERMVASARAGDHPPEETIGALQRALALWRGPALADTRLEGAAAVEASRLDELRLTAIEERIDALLAVGREREVVGELEQLVAAEPLRERFSAQLMLALYRSGRQAEALGAYHRTRKHLIEELGLEPSPELQQLQRAILRHDPGLLPLPSQPPLNRSRPETKRRPWFAVAATLLTVAAIAAAALMLRPSSQSGRAGLSPHSLAIVDASSGAVTGRLVLGGEPDAVAVDESRRVWASEGHDRALVRVDPARMRVLRSFALSSFPVRLAAGGGRAWVGNAFAGTLTAVDAASGRVSVPVRPEPSSTGRLALAYGAGSLWVGSQDNALTRVDPASGRAIARITDVIAPDAIAVGAGAVWVAQRVRAALLRVDTATNRIVRSIPLGATATALATEGDAVWALTPASQRVWRIDPDTNAVTAAIEIGPGVTHIATAAGGIWTAAATTGILQRISPRTESIVRTIRIGRPLGGIASDHNRLWIALR